MKAAITLIVVTICIYFLSKTILQKNSSPEKNITEATIPRSSLNVVIFQDVSGSIKQNGVELISSNVFIPYFQDSTRLIEIHFGCITDASAKKLLTITLYPQEFTKPILQNLNNSTLPEKRTAKEQYNRDCAKYKIDREQYITERDNSIKRFTTQVDSVISIYRKKLTGETDLVTAINIADKVFNASKNATKNILILNSDGEDSHNRSVTKMDNKAIVILTNASGSKHSSMDAIVTKSFQSPEEAIFYSLNL